MPKWGIEMEEGVIREWRAKEGDALKTGDLIAVIETDKISNEVELEFDGVLRRRIGEEGSPYKVGALIGIFADPSVSDAEIDSFIAGFKPADASFLGEASAGSPPAPAAPRGAVIPAGLSLSPKASALASTLGVDLSAFAGRTGRISLQDVEQAAKEQGLGAATAESAEPGANPFIVIKLSSMRRTIARRLTESVQTVPHFYLRRKVSMDPLSALRSRIKLAKGAAPSVNDFLIAASARALKTAPEANVHFMGDVIHQFEHADIAVAVALEGGLVTPVIRRAEAKSVEEISREMTDLVERARAEKLSQDDYRGGTFSLSNLGMFGVESFDAVINPPMAAILAAGSIERAPLETGGFGAVMSVTLSCDHRAIDGALGARFLAAFKDAIESPHLL
jgi:pyruvate dehydrogenase E2 component (dihydrolipoamide acetyltransferase)